MIAKFDNKYQYQDVFKVFSYLISKNLKSLKS